MPGHLRHDVGGGAEAVDAEVRRVAGHAQRAIADQPGAQQRCRLDVGVALGQGKAVAGFGGRVLGVAAIDLVAGELRRIAEVLAAGDAVGARSAGVAEPGNADPVSRAELSPPRTRRSPPVPTISWPGMIGSLASESSPSTTCRSVRHTPHAVTFTSTWPAPGARLRTRNARSGVPGRSSTIACMTRTSIERDAILGTAVYATLMQRNAPHRDMGGCSPLRNLNARDRPSPFCPAMARNGLRMQRKSSTAGAEGRPGQGVRPLAVGVC